MIVNDDRMNEVVGGGSEKLNGKVWNGKISFKFLNIFLILTKQLIQFMHGNDFLLFYVLQNDCGIWTSLEQDKEFNWAAD